MGADRFEFSTDVWQRWSYVAEYSEIRGEEGRIEDFSRADGDKIVIHLDRDSGFYPGDGSKPVFVGSESGDGFLKLGYHHSVDEFGMTDTVLNMVVGTGEFGGTPIDEAVLTITLADYSGDLQASDFIFT